MFIHRVCILQAHRFAFFMDAHCEVWFVSPGLVFGRGYFWWFCLFVFVWFFSSLLFFVCVLFILFSLFFIIVFEALTHQVSGISYRIGPCLLVILKACTEMLLSSSKRKNYI